MWLLEAVNDKIITEYYENLHQNIHLARIPFDCNILLHILHSIFFSNGVHIILPPTLSIHDKMLLHTTAI